MGAFSKTWKVSKDQYNKIRNRFRGIIFSREEDGNYFVRTYQKIWVSEIEAAL